MCQLQSPCIGSGCPLAVASCIPLLFQTSRRCRVQCIQSALQTNAEKKSAFQNIKYMCKKDLDVTEQIQVVPLALLFLFSFAAKLKTWHILSHVFKNASTRKKNLNHLCDAIFYGHLLCGIKLVKALGGGITWVVLRRQVGLP